MDKESSLGPAHCVVAPGDCARRVCHHARYRVEPPVEAAHMGVCTAADVGTVEAYGHIHDWSGGCELEHAQ